MSAQPQRLPDGEWGALAPDGSKVGDLVEIVTRGGKRWTARVSEVLGSMVRTNPIATKPIREVMPCSVTGCAGTWTYRGQASATGSWLSPTDRMCGDCLRGVAST